MGDMSERREPKGEGQLKRPRMTMFDHVLTEQQKDDWWRYFMLETPTPPLDSACPTYLEFGPPFKSQDDP